MYVIAAYDVSVERITKVHALLGQYLHRKQNSLFEGELTKSKLEELKIRLENMIDLGTDKVIIYCLPSISILDKICIGQQSDEKMMIM